MKSNDVLTSITTRPEQALLLQCMLHPSELQAHPLLLASEEIDWSYLTEIAELHGLIPLLFQFL